MAQDEKSQQGARKPSSYNKTVIRVDPREHVYADGVMIGKRVQTPNGQQALRVCDRDRRRSSKRGSRYVDIPLELLAGIPDIEPEPPEEEDTECECED